MRTLSAPELAALSQTPLPLALLIEMDLGAPLNLNTGSIDLDFGPGSSIYYGTRGFGKVEAITETPSETRQLKFELSGVPSTMISLALQEPVQGKAVRMKLALFNRTSGQLLGTPRLRWAGLLDVFAIADGGGTCTLSCTAEHAGIDLLRPVTSYYSDSEQRRLYPGDLAFQYLADQVEQRLVWPDASFGRI